MPVLYRQALSSLSVARATSLDQRLVDYLESLSTRAYFLVYGTRSNLVERVGGFFARAWPEAAKALWRETLASFLLTLAGVLAAYVLTLHDPDWFSAFVPDALANGRGPTASVEVDAGHALRRRQAATGLSVFAAFLFTHNSRRGDLRLRAGLRLLPADRHADGLQRRDAGGLPGGVRHAGAWASRPAGWLVIHGVTELSAVILAGAAGLRIGWTLAFPGDLSRPARHGPGRPAVGDPDGRGGGHAVLRRHPGGGRAPGDPERLRPLRRSAWPPWPRLAGLSSTCRAAGAPPDGVGERRSRPRPSRRRRPSIPGRPRTAGSARWSRPRAWT